MKFLLLLHDFDIRAKDLEVKMIRKNVQNKILAVMITSHLSCLIMSISSALTFGLLVHYRGVDYALPLVYSFILFYMTLWIE